MKLYAHQIFDLRQLGRRVKIPANRYMCAVNDAMLQRRRRHVTPPLSDLSTSAARRTLRGSGTTAERPSPVQLLLSGLLLVLLVFIRKVGALLSPIGDCDETFNYWEPMHYVLYGFGLQTWEYSPMYALRSYAYLYPYAAATRLLSLIPASGVVTPPQLARAVLWTTVESSPKVVQFYSVRIVTALLGAAAEWSLLWSVREFVPLSSLLVLWAFLTFSPGLFRAAPEFLPSSFAMACVTAAHAAWISQRYGVAVLAIALAALLGWIFAAVLGIPLALYIIFNGVQGGRAKSDRDLYQQSGYAAMGDGADVRSVTQRVISGISSLLRWALLSGLPIVAVMTAVDSWHFGRFVCAPLNHVLYNVFPKPGTGSHLYGTEPASYYVINLFLNHPVAAPLFFIYPFVALVASMTLGSRNPHRDDDEDNTRRRRRRNTTSSTTKSKTLNYRFVYVSAAYLAFAVFVIQPHKEERFLTPMYPLVAVAATFALEDVTRLLTALLSACAPGFKRSLPLRTRFRRMVASFVIFATVVTGVSRAAIQVHAFRAPLQIYARLSERLVSLTDTISAGQQNRVVGKGTEADNHDINVCVGAEWYRFPGNMFMPSKHHHIRFLANGGFDGALPMAFTENGTRGAPIGLNEYNRAVPQQFFNGSCHFSVCIKQHGDCRKADSRNGRSQIIMSMPFLDSDHSPQGVRAFYMPFTTKMLKWNDYVVIQHDVGKNDYEDGTEGKGSNVRS